MRNPLRCLLVDFLSTFLVVFAVLLLAATAQAQCDSCGPEQSGSPQGAATTSDFTIDDPGCWYEDTGCSPQRGGFWPGLFGRGCGRGLGCVACGGGPGAGYDGQCQLPTYCGMPAPPYPVPYPTPPNVGYTYFTYPPVMPHHSLPPYRNVYSFRHGPGLSRTTVFWHPTVLRNTLAKAYHVVKLPR